MGADAIEDYLRALRQRLTGPAAVRRDLLAEARDSLRDAAEAYRAAGLDRRQAQLRAVAEFGALDQIAPAYQEELAAASARRLGLLVVVVPLLGVVLGDLTWKTAPWATVRPPDGYLLVAGALDHLQYVLGAAAVLILLGLRRRARTGGDPRTLCRALSVGTLAALGLSTVLGGTVFGWTVTRHPQALTWPPMIVGGMLLLLACAWQLVAALRCLRAARWSSAGPGTAELRPARTGHLRETC